MKENLLLVGLLALWLLWMVPAILLALRHVSAEFSAIERGRPPWDVRR